MATSPLPFVGPKRGHNCYVTPAFSGIPSANRGEKIRSGYLTPAFSGGPKEGGIATQPSDSRESPKLITRASEVTTSPVPSRGPKRKRNCYVTPAFSSIPNAKRGDKNQKWLPHPCLLGGPKAAELLCNPCILENP